MFSFAGAYYAIDRRWRIAQPTGKENEDQAPSEWVLLSLFSSEIRKHGDQDFESKIFLIS